MPLLRGVDEPCEFPLKLDFDRLPSPVAVFADSHCRLEEFYHAAY